MAEENGILVKPAALVDFCVAAFSKVGVPEADARVLADCLVDADLRGVDTHGTFRVRWYLDRIKAGGMAVRTETTIVSDLGATALVDGGDGIGQVIGTRAMKLAIERAKQYGIAGVGVRHSNHLGTLRYYSMMALPENMIGFASSGSGPLMAPWGGLTPLLSTNPWSIAIPTGEEMPIVVDFANTALNSVKAKWMAERGEKLPPGIALTKDGEPTIDPAEARRGLILPIGGHKGYGIMMALEVMSSILPGAAYSTNIPRYIEENEKPQNLGHWMMAIRVDAFGPLEEFKARVDDLIGSMHNSRKAPGVQRIYVPGERSETLARGRRAEGIPLNPPTITALRSVADELGMPAPC